MKFVTLLLLLDILYNSYYVFMFIIQKIPCVNKWSVVLFSINTTTGAQLWNNIGIVKQYNLEEDCSIGVEFHDSSLHHSIHVPNSAGQQGYSLAALSDQALVLAAEAASDAPRFAPYLCTLQ